jgi:signal transduction histidine kinase
VVNDTKLEPDFMPNPLLPDTRSEISMPLMAGNKVLGVLDVQDDQPGRFTESDVDTFSTLAGQVAVALQNAGLFEQVEKNLLETQVRLGVSRALTVAQTEEEVLDVIIQKAGLYPQAQVMLFTIDQEIEEMTVVARRSESFNSGLASLLQPEMRFPASQFQLIQHVEPDKPFISSNIFMDERVDPATREMASQIGTTSMAIFPLIAGNELIGSMAVASKEESFFDERKLHLYQTLALQGGTVLHTARLYDETQRTAARLREVDRLKSEFLANMSHELRTPLNSIIGYAEIMLLGLDGEMDSEIFEDVQAIYDNSHHLLRLINDVLDLAKIEAGRLTLNFEPVEIKSLIDEVSSSTAGLLVNKPVEMIIEVEETLPSIQGDRLRLNQILNNIVSNAAKFTEKGSITLHAYADCSDEADPSDQSDNGWVCIEIQDTGIGISEADQEKIFERFQQVDGSSARRVEGTGLGLAITRHLVELHNGEIELQSQLGQGSTFTVRLPALRQTAESKVNVESV